MNEKIKYGLSAAVLALIGAGASAPEILDQFLDEKEGNHTTAYRDGAGIWTICRGAILVDGKPVIRKRTARAVLTGMCYSAGSAMRHGSSSLTRLTG
ncbi:glycoside hydrolase family protein, partial [Escherichia coli]|uniref:glycoside hydrolase family protein n=1 Tax=Escherichia coli TaxID=562 RepID=UPI003D9CB221